MRRTRMIVTAGALTVTAALAAQGAAGSTPVYVNCSNAASNSFKALQHPASCNIQGSPVASATLLALRDGQWTGWGSATASATGKGLAENPGMGGPPSFPVSIQLSQIKKGCDGKMFYTRMTSKSNPHSALQLSDACKPPAKG